MTNQKEKKTYTHEEVLEKVKEIFSNDKTVKDIVLSKGENFITVSFKDKDNNRRKIIYTILDEPPLNKRLDFTLVNNFSENSYIFNFKYYYNKENGTNFVNCIFLQEANFILANFTSGANFNYAEFSQKAEFASAEFTGGASFYDVDFKNKSNFENAKFQDKANFYLANFTGASFYKVIFEKNAVFKKANFSVKADFRCVGIKGETNFNNAKFETTKTMLVKKPKEVVIDSISFEGAAFKKKVFFSNVKFTQDVCFRGATFFNTTVFEGAEFSKLAYFGCANFKAFAQFSSDTNTVFYFQDSHIATLVFKPLLLKKTVEVNFKSSIINRIIAPDIKFKGKNRETYTILKNHYLKENDRIQALDYYQKEMNEVLIDANKKKKGDRFLLRLEKYSNNFGLNWWLPLFWIIITNCIFVLYGYRIIYNYYPCYLSNITNSISAITSSLIPYNANEDIFGIKIPQGFWYYIKNFINTFLIYQFIISVRKYSRKL